MAALVDSAIQRGFENIGSFDIARKFRC